MSIDITQLANDYNDLMEAKAENQAKVCGLHIRHEHYTDPETLIARLQQEEATAEGWITLPSINLDWKAWISRPAQQSAGYPLAAEIAAGPRSLHLRHDGRSWHLVTYQESETTPGFIAIDTRYAATRNDSEWLHYRVYYQTDQTGSTRAHAARLIGFEPGEPA